MFWQYLKKKKITKKFIPRGNKTNNALILHLDYLQKLLCMKELRFLRDDGDILTPGGEKNPTPPKTTTTHTKTHTTAILWKRKQIQTAGLVLSSSWQLSGGWEAVFWYDAGLNIDFSKQFCYPLTLQCHHLHYLRQPLSTHWQVQNSFKHASPKNSNPYSL